MATEAVEPTEKVPEPERKSLLRSKVPAIEDGQVEPPEPIGSLQETKENLEKFIENLHKKASGAIQWLAAVEPPAVEKPSERQLEFLDFLVFVLVSHDHFFLAEVCQRCEVYPGPVGSLLSWIGRVPAYFGNERQDG